MTTSAAGSAARFVFRDLIGDVLGFPVWWYSVGLMAFVGWAAGQAQIGWQRFALGPWLRNMFAPMYGQRDWQGRIISFFARLLIIGARLVGYAAYLLPLTVLCVGWLLLPPLIAVLIVLQLSHLGA